MPASNPKTVILDIDGLLLHHGGKPASFQWFDDGPYRDEVVGARELLDRLEREGHYIVLITARKRCARKLLKEQLHQCRLYYDQLIMGVTSGVRVLVNDSKPGGGATAIGITLERNAPINVDRVMMQINGEVP